MSFIKQNLDSPKFLKPDSLLLQLTGNGIIPKESQLCDKNIGIFCPFSFRANIYKRVYQDVCEALLTTLLLETENLNLMLCNQE